MYNFYKFLLATLFASFGIICCNSLAIEVTDVEKNFIESNPAQTVVLTQLNSTRLDANKNIYSYKCTVGRYQSNRLACTAHDMTSWSYPHDVELKLRCPRSGSGLRLSYVEIVYTVSTPNVNCYVNEGAVGLGYIGLTINAWNTLMFNYSANFYN